MRLSRQARLTLEGYRAYQRCGGPTFGWLVHRSLPMYLFLAIVIAASIAWVGATSNQETLLASVLFPAGLVIGVLVRDVGYFIQTMRLWPIYSEIINWQRVDEMLDQRE